MKPSGDEGNLPSGSARGDDSIGAFLGTAVPLGLCRELQPSKVREADGMTVAQRFIAGIELSVKELVRETDG